MMSSDRTDLGDRMKSYEIRETSAFMPLLPVIVRIDGRNFSRYTAKMERPYDKMLTTALHGTAKSLLVESGAVVAYTQSDEISLVLYTEDHTKQIYCGGKRQKLVSLLAAEATAVFNWYASACPSWGIARFDCRAFAVPNLDEAANYLLWRELDATRNSITMAAQVHYSHKELHGKSGAAKMDMLMAKGVNWNDYPAFFKRGAYFRRVAGENGENPVVSLKLPPLQKLDHATRVQVLLGNPAVASFELEDAA